MITFDEFKKVEIRIGRIVAAERVAGTEKLIKLAVDLGGEQRQIVAGMGEFLQPDHFVGKEVPVVVNLAPHTFRGVESQGMILAADVEGRPVLLHPESDVPPGSLVR